MNPRRWSLWSTPRPVLAYVLAVIVVALVVAVLTARLLPVTSQSWAWFGVLTAGSIIHLQAARGIERMREIAAEGRPYVHLQDVWLFAGVLLLPPPLTTTLICVSFAHEWFVVFRRRALLHRKVFSASTVVIAAGAATAVLSAVHPLGTTPYASLPGGPAGLAGLAAAAGTYWLVNYALVAGAIMLTYPGQPARKAFGHPSDQLIVWAGVGVASMLCLVLVTHPWWTPVLLVTVLALHMGLLLPQFRAASRTDSKTGLVDAVFWADMAHRELDRAGRLESTVGMLLCDLDHFRGLNTTYGHPGADTVLRAVADTIRHSVRSYDLVGRYGGDEFAVLLPGIQPTELAGLAERIRLAVADLSVQTLDRTDTLRTVTGLSLSIGGATYPHDATDAEALMRAADDALFLSKDSGRNRVTLAADPPRRLALRRRQDPRQTA